MPENPPKAEKFIVPVVVWCESGVDVAFGVVYVLCELLKGGVVVCFVYIIFPCAVLDFVVYAVYIRTRRVFGGRRLTTM